MKYPKAKTNQVIFIIDYETLETHIYNGDGKDLKIHGEIDHTKDGKRSVIVNVKIDLEE